MKNNSLQCTAPRRTRQLSAVALALSLTACANMSDIRPQALVLDASPWGLTAAGAAALPAATEWWREFGDEQLNRLMAQALVSNPSLKVAQARLARARAATDIVDAATLPQINGALDLTRQRYTANGLYPPPLAGTVNDSGTAQITGSWELDFFGKNRAALDAALGQVKAAQADAQAAGMLLASQVARSYFQLVRLNEQLNVARRTLAQREETLRLVQDRVNAGLDTRLELRQSEGGLPQARLQIELLQEQLALTRNALGALTLQPKVVQALAVPPQAAINNIASTRVVPVDLLGRRADIAAARWRVEAATQDVGNAKTQFYPNINLVAFAGFSSIGLDRLLEAGSQQWGVGPALRLPLFDGGRLRANLRSKTADLDAAVESYNATVIDAVRDVADQVASAQSISRQQTEQRAAQAAAQAAYEIALQRYQAGLGNYLQVLAAEAPVLEQRRQAVDLSARALETEVALIRAVGGSYGAAPLPTVAKATDGHAAAQQSSIPHLP